MLTLILILFFSIPYSNLFATKTLPNKSKLSITEQINAKSTSLDSLTALEIATLMNQEDYTIAQAITPCLSQIADAVEHIVHAMKQGGRLIYIGAGSSGRLGVLDASECVPTFSVPKGKVVGIIAGGDQALRTSIEFAEDNQKSGIDDLKTINLTNQDVVCGISCSGAAQYVNHAMKYAKQLGCFTMYITCNPSNTFDETIDCLIAPVVGPEILAGSTRLKSGTATKMVLNMLTTGTFVRLGKVYKNYMVDVAPVNNKLIARSNRILQAVLDINEAKSQELFEKSKHNVKLAIIMHSLNLDYEPALELLRNNEYAPLAEILFSTQD